MSTSEYWAYEAQLESEACYTRARYWLEAGLPSQALLWQDRAARLSAAARERLR